MGRPSLYTQELADRICERHASGESLRAMCMDDDMPSRTAVKEWLRTNEEFAANYARARDEQADWFADDILSIADDPVLSPDEKRIRIDARKWRAGRQAPKRWGDKVELNANHSGTVALDAGSLPAALSFLAGHSSGAEGGPDTAAG